MYICKDCKSLKSGKNNDCFYCGSDITITTNKQIKVTSIQYQFTTNDIINVLGDNFRTKIKEQHTWRRDNTFIYDRTIGYKCYGNNTLPEPKEEKWLCLNEYYDGNNNNYTDEYRKLYDPIISASQNMTNQEIYIMNNYMKRYIDCYSHIYTCIINNEYFSDIHLLDLMLLNKNGDLNNETIFKGNNIRSGDKYTWFISAQKDYIKEFHNNIEKNIRNIYGLI